MEYSDYGPLLRLLKEVQKVETCVNMKLARFMCKRILLAVKYMHKRRFAHLDIKHENILLDKNLQPKLSGFGLSAELKEELNGFVEPLK